MNKWWWICRMTKWWWVCRMTKWSVDRVHKIIEWVYDLFKIQTKTPLYKFPSNTHTKPLNSHPAQTYTHTKPSNDHPTHTQTHIKPSNDKIHVQKFVTDLMFSVLSLVEGLAGDAQIIKSGHTDDKIGTHR